MKVTYEELKCVSCGAIAQIMDGNFYLPRPYWFTIRTEGRKSSSEEPSFNTTACSFACLEEAGAIIGKSIKERSHLIPHNKNIVATICDHCGKVVKCDTLNPLIGPSPLRDWTWEASPAGKKDFCGISCKKNHSQNPELSVFAGLRFEMPWEIRRLVKAIDSPNIREALMSNENVWPKRINVSSMKEAIRLANQNPKR